MASKKVKVIGNKTRTGKRLDPKTGKVVVPAVTKDADSGKLRALTEGEKKTARTTVLPAASPTPEKKPQGRMGLGAKPVTSGGARGGYPIAKAAVDAARTHLQTMQDNPVGSPEHHEAHETFNAIHANIGKISPELHTLLGQAKHFVTNSGEGTPELLALTHKAINTRLGIIKKVHQTNIEHADAGRLRKAGNA